MSSQQYYESLKKLAREERLKHGISHFRILPSHMRVIFKSYGIRIDLSPKKLKKLRGAYFNDECGPTVLLDRGLPKDPRVFTMAHELKHHLVDSSNGPASYCAKANEHLPVEVGAEVFAAEFMFPDEAFCDWMKKNKIEKTKCGPEQIIKLKRETGTTLSFAGLAKKAIFLDFSSKDALARVQWKKLEEKIYGEPLYKRINRFRKRKSANK